MKIKFKSDIHFTVDASKNTVFFSVQTDCDEFMVLSGLAAIITTSIYSGKDITDIKKSITEEYDVTDAQLNQDIEELINQLKKINFIE